MIENQLTHNAWWKVWNEREIGINNFNDPTILEQLIKIDGFDGPFGKISVTNWKDYASMIGDRLRLQDNESLFEVGCGAGAFLYPFYKKGHYVAGIDYSENLIGVAQKCFSSSDFTLGAADSLDPSTKYDIITANSTFSYFPDMHYADKVLDKMFCKANRCVAILDIPNLESKHQCEKNRGQLIENYDSTYKNTKHLYYSKNWFIYFAALKKTSIDIFDQSINYCNSAGYRFNCIIYK